MTDLPLPDGALAGLVAWYSIIHIPPALLPGVLAGFHRVLAPSGRLLLAFKAGDGGAPLRTARRGRLDRLEQAYGHTVSYDVHWLSPDRVAAQLAAAGFTLHARLDREREDREKGPQSFLLAVRTDGAVDG